MFDMLGSIQDFQKHLGATNRLLERTPSIEIEDAIYIHYAAKNDIKIVPDHDHMGFLNLVRKTCDPQKYDITFRALHQYYLINQWDRKRQIYVFDSDFTKELMDTQNINMIKGMLSKLPVDTFALDFSQCKEAVDQTNVAGGLVNVKLYGNYWMIRASFHNEFNNENMCASHVIFLKDEDIDCTAEEFVESQLKISRVDDPDFFEVREKLWSLLLHTLAYMCSYAPDIHETTTSKALNASYKRQKHRDPANKPGREYHVGERFGAAFRKWTNGSIGASRGHTESTGTVRPHLRRAHWHRYWVGKRDNKELVVKWVSECFVNGAAGEIDVTSHKVK